VRISISPSRTAWVLSAVVILLAAASLAGQVSRLFLGHDRVLGLVPLFDLDDERNIPTWFSGALLLLGAGLFWTIAQVKRAEKDPFARHWMILSVIFCLLSLDEVAAIHEIAGHLIRAKFEPGSYLYYGWVIPGGLLVILLALSYVKFLRHLPARTTRLLILAGALYVGGSIGMELIEGRWESRHGSVGWPYVFMYTVEEVCEMFGLVTLVFGLMDYMSGQMREVRAVIEEAPRS